MHSLAAGSIGHHSYGASDVCDGRNLQFDSKGRGGHGLTSRDKINWKNPRRLFSPWGNSGPIWGRLLGPKIQEKWNQRDFGPKWVFRLFQTHFPANHDLADISVVTNWTLGILKMSDFGPCSASEFSRLSALFSGKVPRLERVCRSVFFKKKYQRCSIWSAGAKLQAQTKII